MSMTTIVLADDHHVVRQGLRSLLEAESDFSVVGEAGDGLEATQLVERLQPDVLVLDLMMPSLNGLEVTRQVSQRSPRTHVVILSMHPNEAYVLEALRAGAAAYVLKESIEVYMQKAESAALDPYETLTAREREVLHLVAEGHTNAEIADRLFISRRTVETHRANLMRKLGLRTQTDLISYALRRGILPME